MLGGIYLNPQVWVVQDRHGDVVDVHCGVEGELDAHRLLSVLPADPTVTFIYIYNIFMLMLLCQNFIVHCIMHVQAQLMQPVQTASWEILSTPHVRYKNVHGPSGMSPVTIQGSHHWETTGVGTLYGPNKTRSEGLIST